MDELIDILTPDGKPTGKVALKSEAHKNGWFHATVHIWFFTKDDKILLQKRAMTKKVFPGLWDISVAGHIGAGETILDAAIREVHEELGLEIKSDELLKIGTRIHQVSHANGIQDNEHHHVFIAELKVPIESLSIQKEEVDDVQLFDLAVLKNTKNIENVLLPRFHEYYCMVYDTIIESLHKK
ncbi:MAG: NUDIX domain-containing protein [Flavobacteriia bacterium]|nr:NUDIX domain-containing protein [Flavobacteriia bacterium]OIP45417.1 MAG: hydrolase [Flavobacteriaceae bacterium CG2_30_31_66]PIV96043.1 MAG: hydrolase [Flavobacteriaceae bacterium CG17_big_fil_post_rev_8_21_14_2_50_31_13]PIX12739.1 MAG: hydrolase [Flavobacteriaceae bacterium CG_4_8_14_3_um_filter_31_8]PIY13955.1 MAG: hydrolase [Flavobacteriaceae bacterium CG_4_10_14_3_um_filter_31_253]PIZ10997.1 MAG: hydrolase [Flavobacteriaceae bacterium CG_4_10_14_0_8_um_filter_31_99]PJC10926.1 MAG: hyd